ncbi:MAG: NAD(P)-dependent alcohol dehydrogenase [Zetaproteobacteria bacterium]|nr:NAD(P)-dependent alcohol dehydrogenase [Zetaproteobacteria bacterium]
MQVQAMAAHNKSSALEPYNFTRRQPKPHDVQIKIEYCGICHSDIHTVRDEWGGAVYPIVPGHEIVGKVLQVGAKVTRFKPGDQVGVGCFVDSCRTCSPCRDGEEQYCEAGMTATYNAYERDGKTRTQGGYSTGIVVDENYVLRIPEGLPLDRAAPLLCAGITTYSPMKHFGLQPGQKLGVIGLGGLGHMAVQIGHAMGAHVTVFSSSEAKRASASALGAQAYVHSQDQEALQANMATFDLLINTVSAPIDQTMYIQLLKKDGTMAIVGLPDQPTTFVPFPLVLQRRRIAGSLIGGIAETQEMLDFCAQHNISAHIETIPLRDVNIAYERIVHNDIQYRFVIDMSLD